MHLPRRRGTEQALSLCRGAAPPGSVEEQWRQDCLAFARVRKLGHVADMRIFYAVSPLHGLPPHACAPGMQHAQLTQPGMLQHANDGGTHCSGEGRCLQPGHMRKD